MKLLSEKGHEWDERRPAPSAFSVQSRGAPGFAVNKLLALQLLFRFIGWQISS